MAYSSSISYDFSEQQGNLDNEPDHIYYNANIVSQNALTEAPLGKAPVVQFQETRSTALISDVSKYDFSITRFTMNGCGRNLPLFIPQIQVNGGDRDLTSYGITLDWVQIGSLTYGGFTVTTQTYSALAYVQFASQFYNAYVSEGKELPFPPTTTNQQNIAQPYYYVMSYQWWLDLVNTTMYNLANQMLPPSSYYPSGSLPYQFGLAWGLISTRIVNEYVNLPAPASVATQTWFVKGLTGGQTGFWLSSGGVWVYQTNYKKPSWASTPPSILYKGTTFTILVPYNFAQGTSSVVNNYTPPAYPSATGDWGNLYFNSQMYGLFANYNFLYIGQYTPSYLPISGAVGKTYLLLVEDLNGTNYYTPPSTATPTPTNPPTYLELNQEYNSTSQLWSPIESIVFTSTLIPLYSEQVGAPIVYGEGNNLTTNTSSSAFTPIITDVSLPLNTANDYRDFIEYAPTAEYRLTSFTSSKQECRAIDIQVFWKSRLTSTLVPVTLYNASSVSLKVLFRKKGIGKKG